MKNKIAAPKHTRFRVIQMLTAAFLLIAASTAFSQKSLTKSELLISSGTPINLIISEFRLQGPTGMSDEFIEIYNNSETPHTVSSSDGSAGYGVAASDGVLRFTIPNGTVIPARGHYLSVNSAGYSLASYPAGNGITATGDATYTTGITLNAGIALFSTSNPVNFNPGSRLDAVGSTSEANPLYKEGTGYGSLANFYTDHSIVRQPIGGTADTSDTVFPTIPHPRDTNDNNSDFYFVDTNGTSMGFGQRLGAPGPENLSSPLINLGQPMRGLLDSCAGLAAPPNIVRDYTSDPANNSTFGTLDVRRTFTNTSGSSITRMRFRILKLSTFPAPSDIADLRPRSSSSVAVTVDRAPCGSGTSNVTVQGTTLEQPPTQANGGGFNSTMSADTITLGTPLANGDSIDLRFLFGIQQNGNYAMALVVEALPAGGTYWTLQGNTENNNDPGAGGRAATENSPTAAAVTVSGRALTPEGKPVSRAIVQMTDANGATRTARTGTFGYFTFDNVAVGGTYIFGVSSKFYQFSPQIVNVSESVTDLTLMADR